MESERKKISFEPGSLADLPLDKKDTDTSENEIVRSEEVELSVPIEVPLATRELLKEVKKKISEEPEK